MRIARTLSLYVMRETLVYFVLTFLAVTLILLVQNLFARMDEIFVIGLAAGEVARVALCLLPVAFAYSIPLSLLVGVVLAARRLGADGELLALRASGVGPLGYLAPNLALGLAATVLLAWLVTSLEHASRRELLSLVKSVAARGAILEPKKFRRIGDRLVFVEDRSPDGELSGVMIYDASAADHPFRLFAERGRFRFDEAQSEIEIELENGDVHLDPTEAEPRRSARIHFDRFEVALDVSNVLGRDLGPVRPKQMTQDELERVLERARAGDPLAELDQKDPVEYALELARRRTLPVAPLLFTALAVPIALASEQRGSGLALPLALAAAFGYFALGSLAELIVHQGWLSVALASWLPNLICAAAAIGFFRFSSDRIPR